MRAVLLVLALTGGAMATDFPTDIQLIPTPGAADSMKGANAHHDLHELVGQTLEALQVKVGIDGSADTDSLDYRVTQVEAEVGFVPRHDYPPIAAPSQSLVVDFDLSRVQSVDTEYPFLLTFDGPPGEVRDLLLLIFANTATDTDVNIPMDEFPLNNGYYNGDGDTWTISAGHTVGVRLFWDGFRAWPATKDPEVSAAGKRVF